MATKQVIKVEYQKTRLGDSSSMSPNPALMSWLC